VEITTHIADVIPEALLVVLLDVATSHRSTTPDELVLQVRGFLAC